MFQLRFLFFIAGLIAISDASSHVDEQLKQEFEQAKQEQIELAQRVAKLERQAVALEAEQTYQETSGRSTELIVGVIVIAVWLYPIWLQKRLVDLQKAASLNLDQMARQLTQIVNATKKM